MLPRAIHFHFVGTDLLSTTAECRYMQLPEAQLEGNFYTCFYFV